MLISSRAYICSCTSGVRGTDLSVVCQLHLMSHYEVESNGAFLLKMKWKNKTDLPTPPQSFLYSPWPVSKCFLSSHCSIQLPSLTSPLSGPFSTSQFTYIQYNYCPYCVFEANLITQFTCTAEECYVNLAVSMRCWMQWLLNKCTVVNLRGSFCHRICVTSNVFHKTPSCCMNAAALVGHFPAAHKNPTNWWTVNCVLGWNNTKCSFIGRSIPLCVYMQQIGDQLTFSSNAI